MEELSLHAVVIAGELARRALPALAEVAGPIAAEDIPRGNRCQVGGSRGARADVFAITVIIDVNGVDAVGGVDFFAGAGHVGKVD